MAPRLTPRAACVTPACHTRIGSAPYVHGATASCNACHAPDQGGHRYPLIRQGNAMCTYCHANIDTGDYRVEHKAVTTAGCLGCHDPHSSNAKFLLVTDSVESLCGKCHSTALKKYAHLPYLKGECTVCHQPHEANNRYLLRGGTGTAECLSCHRDMATAFKQATIVHQPAGKACTICHDPHTSDYPHQLKEPMPDNCFSCHQDVARHVMGAKVPHGAVSQGAMCVNCHSPHAAREPYLLWARGGALCLRCHDKELKTPSGRALPSMTRTLARRYLHGPVRSGDCSACHDIHGGKMANLLREAFPDTFYTSFSLDKYALCFSCHSKELVLTKYTTNLTGFRNGNLNLHYVHVNRADKGRTCKACHAVHGSDLPLHMATTVPFEGSWWAMPIGFVKTADGGSCSPGCHAPRTYSRDAAATTQPSPEGTP